MAQVMLRVETHFEDVSYVVREKKKMCHMVSASVPSFAKKKVFMDVIGNSMS